MSLRRVLAGILLLATPAAMGASLCDGPCSVSMDFPAGGAIDAADGATLTFGPEYGLLELGDGGSIVYGEGGHFFPLEGGPANMSQGGTIYLGPGGAINFGPGGILRTGPFGGISVPDGGRFDATSARTVTIDAESGVRLGAIATAGVVDVTSAGDILFEESASPFNFTMPAEDAESRVAVTAGDDVVWGKLLGTPSVNIIAPHAQSVSAWFEGPSGEVTDPTLSCGGASAGSLHLSTTGTVPDGFSPCLGTIGAPIVAVDVLPGLAEQDRQGGAMNSWGLLIGLAALWRRRGALARGVAGGLLLASTAAAADLCDGPCSVTLDYANGGGVVTNGAGATITFGPGGVLFLGTGGSITLGTGGSLTPNVDPPDMSAGGTLVLGAGGSVTFGDTGLLDTGSAGNIATAEGGTIFFFDMDTVAIDATQGVHLFNVDTDGAATITAGGAITTGDNSTPISFDSTVSADVTSDADVTLGTVTAPSVTLNQGSGTTGPGFVDCSSGCPTGSQSTIGSPTLPADSGTLGPYPQGSGATGLLTLLPLLLAGLLRRR